jgi:hypothetical protein
MVQWEAQIYTGDPQDAGLPFASESQDFPVKVEVWDERMASPYGVPQPVRWTRGPAATSILDDEAVQSITDDPSGIFASNVYGGVRARYRDKFLKWWHSEFPVTGIPVTFRPLGPPSGKTTNSLIPILAKKQLIEEGYRLATVKEGIVTMPPSEIPQGNYNDTKCRILEEVQRHFLEPNVDRGLEWQLWSYEEVHEVYELRLYRFLLETGINRKEYEETTRDSQVTIPQDSIEIRRVQWEYLDERDTPRALRRIDTRQADSGRPGWDTTENEPDTYIEDPMVNTMELTLCPHPDDFGKVGQRYVYMPETSKETPCESVPIPRMFTWALKWGIIADLLKKEGEANDPVRARAAEFQYRLGVQLCRLLLGTEI